MSILSKKIEKTNLRLVLFLIFFVKTDYFLIHIVKRKMNIWNSSFIIDFYLIASEKKYWNFSVVLRKTICGLAQHDWAIAFDNIAYFFLFFDLNVGVVVVGSKFVQLYSTLQYNSIKWKLKAANIFPLPSKISNNFQNCKIVIALECTL